MTVQLQTLNKKYTAQKQRSFRFGNSFVFLNCFLQKHGSAVVDLVRMLRIGPVLDKTFYPAVVEPTPRFPVSDIPESKFREIPGIRKTPVQFQLNAAGVRKQAGNISEQNIKTVFDIREIRRAETDMQDAVFFSGGQDLNDAVSRRKRDVFSRRQERPEVIRVEKPAGGLAVDF